MSCSVSEATAPSVVGEVSHGRAQRRRQLDVAAVGEHRHEVRGTLLVRELHALSADARLITGAHVAAVRHGQVSEAT